MKNKRALLVLAVLTIFPILVRAQAVDSEKVNLFAHAIAAAEGFGVPHAIPTRYHNPGDLKTTRRFSWDGQKSIGKGGHVVFKSDAAGWAALRHQITMAVNGDSHAYNAHMTINQVAKRYAGNWRVWSKNVSKQLGVPPTTTLRAYFTPEEPVAPSIEITAQADLSDILNTTILLPILAEN